VTSRVDVIIVNHNTRVELLDCVRSLASAPPASLGRVIVVDNASTDDSVAAIAADFPAVETIALPRNIGFAAANNVALRQVTAPLALLLNSDTILPSPQALDRLVERLEATGAIAAGPRLVDADGRPEVSFGRMLSPVAELAQAVRGRIARSRWSVASGYIRRLVSQEREVDWVSGACLLVRREAAIAAGLLDERYFMYEEDVDFCAALRARGGRILFTPAAEIVHLRGRSRASTGAGTDQYDRSHLAFYEKHRPGWAPVLRLWQRLRGRAVR
jgi:GT2 family glycosyltransferase